MARRGARTTVSGQPAAAGGAASTRGRILDVALDLFVRKGYTETSLREVAAELGFSKAALYYHFESKQDILMALHMRVHGITDEVLPVLAATSDAGDRWERLVDRLIGVSLRHRRLIELHIRNQDAMADLHRDPALAKHGPVMSEMQDHLLDLLRDPSVSPEARIRRMASLGAIAGVVLGASAFGRDLPDAELEPALRRLIPDVLGTGARRQ